jgi:adenosylhomocysteine nucleosidase
MIAAAAVRSYGDEPSVVGVLGALDEEVALIERSMDDPRVEFVGGIRFVTGNVGGRRVVLARTGAGKVNAAMAATLLIERFQPGKVICLGVAGAINPELRPGDIVIAEKAAQHDLGTLTAEGFERRGARSPLDGVRAPVFIPADSLLLRLAGESGKRVAFERVRGGVPAGAGTRGEKKGDARGNAPRVIRGTVVTGDMFVSSREKKREIREKLDADAVDMEGAAVAQVCWMRGIGCLVIRCVSDSADERAAVDFREFAGVAAANSARLVLDLLGRMKE